MMATAENPTRRIRATGIQQGSVRPIRVLIRRAGTALTSRERSPRFQTTVVVSPAWLLARAFCLCACWRCGGYTSDIADAIVWASGGSVSGVPANSNVAKVVNLSLGGAGACDTTTQNAINSARTRGTVIVVAAGNENQNASNSSPANCSGVIAVASVNRSGGRAYYSNFGSVVDVAAPGGDVRTSDSNGVLSTLNSGSTTPGSDIYGFYQGMSMAAPHVAGVVALMLARNSALSADEVESRLRASTRPFPATCSQCGTGIVDALSAVNAATGGGNGDDTEVENGVAVTNLSGSSSTELRYTIAVPTGASNLQIQMSGGSGDADLYVRFGAAPTTSTYNCRRRISISICNAVAAAVG
jgi:serine protease